MRAWARVRVEALNAALKGLPEDRIRFHTCYGINIGPRIHEMNLGPRSTLIHTEIRPRDVVREQAGIIDLKQQASVDDGAVLLTESIRDRKELLFI